MCHPAGGVPCEAINAATGFAAAGGLSVAGAAFLARRSAGQSAAASSCADAVAREADGSGVGAAAEARSEGHTGTNQIGMGCALIICC